MYRLEITDLHQSRFSANKLDQIPGCLNLHLARETQDLRVYVVPEINAGAASLAYAAINPAIGLGTFIAQWLLRRPLIAAATREFHVTGSWDDPQVERVERKQPEAASAGQANPTQ